MDHRRRLFGSMARSTINDKLAEAGYWKGTRKGYRMELRNDGTHISWRVRITGKWTGGRAGSVYDALGEIERAAAHA